MHSDARLPAWLAGDWSLASGTRADYAELARYHYVAGPPATWATVVAIRHRQPEHVLPSFRNPGRLAAVGVLSWPTALSKPRRQQFGLAGLSYREQIAFANAHLRTISRVIVRPAYRGCGLASVVIAELIRRCPTRFVETTARMAGVHPMFERAGMRRVEVAGDDRAYFWVDRAPGEGMPRVANAAPRPIRGIASLDASLIPRLQSQFRSSLPTRCRDVESIESASSIERDSASVAPAGSTTPRDEQRESPGRAGSIDGTRRFTSLDASLVARRGAVASTPERPEVHGDH